MGSNQDDDPFACFDESDNDNDSVGFFDTTNKTKTPAMNLMGGNQEPSHATRDPTCGVLSFHPNTERSLLTHVENALEVNKFQQQTNKAADAVLKSIDNYCNQRHWMMHVGPKKGEILTRFLDSSLKQFEEKCSPSMKSKSFVAVEVGTYCGYAAILMAQRALNTLGQDGMDKFHLYTVEVNPINAEVAKSLIQLANMQEWVTVVLFDPEKTTLANAILQAIGKTKHKTNNCIDFLFLDHDKDLYLSDLLHLQDTGLICKGTHVAADNVVFARIDAYCEYMKHLANQSVVQAVLSESQLEYSEVEPRFADMNPDTFRDGIELTIYLQDPPARKETA